MRQLIENDVRTVMSTLSIDGNNVTINAQLDRKLYLAVNKVLDRIGGKWNRKAKAHVFDGDPTERLNNVIECGVLDPMVKTGYFPTPAKIVDKMIELAELDSLGRFAMILEPSAGQGHIADKIRVSIVDDNCAAVHVCENLPENMHILEEKGYMCDHLDFFKYETYCLCNNIVYDRILMNPPFERQADIDHVTAAFNLLAPDGVLVAIMSAGVMFRENRKTVEFREKIMEPHGTHIEQLPTGAFKESGTMVNTILLRLERGG